MTSVNSRRPTPRMLDLDHCLCCGQTEHWVRACPYNQPVSSTFGGRQFQLNLVHVNRSRFTAELIPNSSPLNKDDMLLQGI
ncbi:hypothetical protein CROQUDRAFT_697104 [Cronartium quercuum f. sp. fusiforme G11]|uniref:CCHC-type domain-containing protein n=1 Tax=Cronartium quercuum f. sp. fusiforme G11 TaxID=708437 RepID=A0A9P6NLI0_9BASI|nr:hypothetical protein CROQUDRAFT_697104 [Cronartium quercuum f. sp. fusiforme G11]